MPSRKQRRRREKSLRHDYDFVVLDDSGQEVSVAPSELRAQKEKDKPKPTATTRGKGKTRATRTAREVQPPSWERALRKGGLWGGVMLLAFVFLFKNGALLPRIGFGLFYAIAFVPLTYWIDRTAYRSYLKRSGKTPPVAAKKH